MNIAPGNCALIFATGLTISLTKSIIGSKGVGGFTLYSKRFGGAVLIAAGRILRHGNNVVIRYII